MRAGGVPGPRIRVIRFAVWFLVYLACILGSTPLLPSPTRSPSVFIHVCSHGGVFRLRVAEFLFVVSALVLFSCICRRGSVELHNVSCSPFGREGGVHRLGEIPGCRPVRLLNFRFVFCYVLPFYLWTSAGWSTLGQPECVAQRFMSTVEPTAADLVRIGFALSRRAQPPTERYG